MGFTSRYIQQAQVAGQLCQGHFPGVVSEEQGSPCWWMSLALAWSISPGLPTAQAAPACCTPIPSDSVGRHLALITDNYRLRQWEPKARSCHSWRRGRRGLTRISCASHGDEESWTHSCRHWQLGFPLTDLTFHLSWLLGFLLFWLSKRSDQQALTETRRGCTKGWGETEKSGPAEKFHLIQGWVCLGRDNALSLL